ncbi:MAG: GHKL domain-containing protein [Clostridia bacterium]|nr:GHKL domain-containing protein [Clostridia bacterium]
MEFLQTIWTALTTQNEQLSLILCIPFFFVDAIVSMLLFTTILDIHSTKKRTIIYVITISIVAAITRNLIPDPYGIFINMLSLVLLVKFVLKTSWLKSFIAVFIMYGIASVSELFLLKLYLTAFKTPYESVMYVPLIRIAFTLSIYLSIYLLYRIIKYGKFHINLDAMTKKNKILFIFTTILGLVAIGTQFAIMAFYSDKMPIVITIISMVSLLGYFIMNIYSILSTSKLDTTSRDLEEAQLHNKTLIILHDTMRGFKHDFHNIVQGIGGYIDREDLPGLKKYYEQLLQDCNRVNNLTALSPNVINNPAIYNVMADKYHKADEMGIQINLGIFMDLNEIETHMKIYEFTRILGILLDNAIEAASECKQKVIHVTYRKEENRHRLVMVIENTYLNKNIDIDQIFQKAYSTKSKETNSGLGLWEIRQILKKNNHLNLYTTKNEEYFKQQFEIYY